MNNLPSELLSKAVEELNRLPGVGKKTALRLALFLLTQEKSIVENFGNTIINFRKNVKFCEKCFNISDREICEICISPKRNTNTLCIVADVRDVMAVENTNFYNGLYHIIGGLISPMDGISPNDLNLHSLVERVTKENIEEIILALPATPEGDTTAFYISKILEPYNILITSIAKGIAIGDELEYTDEITLGRSIVNRLPF